MEKFYFSAVNACTTTEQMSNYALLLRNETLLNEELTKAKCIPLSCKQSSWQYKVIFQALDSLQYPANAILQQLPTDLLESHMVLHIFMNSEWVEEIRHYGTYNFFHFIADFGGYLGLLLGGSLLTIFDEIINIIRHLLVKIKRPQL